ncbi:hypothetical protein KKH35_01705 [Patescibacteria group bacterium]|nr:hypothetical protein [Patescibacteria group bacterium]
MFFKEPENTKEIYWTRHVKEKMRYYGLSESRLKRILRNPQRKEIGIAPKTIALMQTTNTKKQTEIWLMYQPASPASSADGSAGKQKTKRKVMISAWCYPGISPKGEPIPIPEDIIKELRINKVRPIKRNLQPTA